MIFVPVLPPGNAACNPKTITETLIRAMNIHRAGDLRTAESIYRRILDLQPDNPDALQLLGLLAENVGRLEAAAELMSRSLSVEPNQSDVWSNLGFVLWKLGRFEEAEICCRQAVRLNPQHTVAHVNLGNALKDQNKIDEAVVAYENAVRLNSETGLSNLGNLLKDQGRLSEAITCYKRAIELKPDDMAALSNLGVACLERGDLSEARESYSRALDIRSDYAVAHFNLTFVKKYGSHDEQLRKMEDLFDNPKIGDEDRMYLGFALGKAYEDLGMYEKSFGCMQEGNRLKRRTFNYNVRQTQGRFEKIKAVFDGRLFAEMPGSGCEDPTPVFILGMPRSGTSLVEQILASHPDVHGAGEIEDLHRVIEGRSKENPAFSYPDSVPSLTAGQLGDDGRRYLDRLRRHSKTARFITDKMPGNFEYIGLIKLMLPAAKVIHCRRDPLDNCLSLFKNLLVGVHAYAYDQVELGQYYCLYRELMAHWHDRLPGFIHDVWYEDLVNHQEESTGRLLDFCGLDWKDACLDFFRTKRQVQTASAAQVRQPIYKTSLRSWTHYKEFLQPLLEVLDRAGLAGRT